MFSQNSVTGNAANYTTFVLPGILVLTVLSSAGMSGIANYSLRSNGSYYRIYISPVKRSSIVLGTIFDVAVLSFIEIFVLIGLSLLLSARISSGFLGFMMMMILLLLTVFFVAGLSYSLSFTFQDENPFIAVVNTIIMPLFFVSTALMPLEQIPTFFQIPVKINPFTYAVNSLRNLVTDKAIDWQQFLFAFILMFVLSILSFLLATYQLKKESQA